MKLTIEKPKTKKGMSYALQTSVLQEKLAELKADVDILLKYWTPNSFATGYPIFNCEQWLPNPRVDSERYYITVCPVKAEDKQRVAELLEQKVLPEFVVWLKQMITLPNNSTSFNQRNYFKAVFQDNQVTVNFSS